MLHVTVFDYLQKKIVGIIFFITLLFAYQSNAQTDIPVTAELELWLKADAGVTEVSDYLDIWSDQSGKNRYVENIADDNRISFATNAKNGKPGIYFTNGDHAGLKLKNSDGTDLELSLSDDYQIFVVMQPENHEIDNNGVGKVGFMLAGSTQRTLWGLWEGYTYVRGGTATNNSTNTDKLSWTTDSDWALINFQRNDTNDRSVDFNINGGLFTNLPNNSSGDNKTNAHTIGIIGAMDLTDANKSYAWDGYISEIIIYSSCDDQTRLRVNDYLTEKYGLDHAETTEADELNANFSSANKNIRLFGNEGGNAFTPKRTTDSPLEITVDDSSDAEFLIVGETDENGYTFENSPNESRMWAKKFYIEKSGSDLDMTFSFNVKSYEGIDNDDGRIEDDYKLVYSSDNGSTYTEVADVSANFDGTTDYVKFTVTDANFDGNGYYTLASTATAYYPIKGLQDKNWSDPTIWTQNASGSPDGSNKVPTAGDNVVILSGTSIILDVDNISAAVLEVETGGILKVGTKTGHSFGEVNGKGKIVLESDNFPSAANAVSGNGFLTSNGGTVEFTGSGTTLSTTLTYHNVKINLESTTDELVINSDLTFSGTVEVQQGKLEVGLSDGTNNAIDLTFDEDVTVNSTGSIGIGTDNVKHNITMSGNFTNGGTVAFVNNRETTNEFKSSAYYIEVENFATTELSGQYAIVYFDADNKDQNLLCNGPTTFYQMVVDKGSSDQYVLNIDAAYTGPTEEPLFRMYGYSLYDNQRIGEANAGLGGSMDLDNGMFVHKFGTLRLGANIYIYKMCADTDQNYDLDADNKLWIDGADVNFGYIDGLTIYGSVLVSDGRLNIGLNTDGTSNGKHNSITLREQGYLVQEGGEIFINQLKTSNAGSDHQGSVSITGGEMTVYGYTPKSSVAAFSLPYHTNIFNMSGGKITIKNEGSNLDYLTKFGMEEGNYTVTGGEIVFDINTNRDASFQTAIPFYDLTVNSIYPLKDVSLSNSTGTFGDDLPTNGDLTVLNDLKVNEESNLKIESFDLTIGGSLTLFDNAELDLNSTSTLTFNGENQFIDVKDKSAPYSIGNLVIDQPTTSSTFEVKGIDSGAGIGDVRLEVTELTVSQGIFDYADYVVEVTGKVTNNGRIGASDANGYLLLDGTTGAQTITSTYELVEDQVTDTTNVGITHLWLNNNDGINLDKILYTTKFTWEEGIISTNEYGVVIGALGFNNEGGNAIGTNNKIILGSGNASDGGLTYLVHSNGTYDYPLATDFDTPVSNNYKYTPASITVSNINEQGFIQLAPSNSSLVDFTVDPTDATNLLDYFWKSNVYDYSSDANKPDVTLSLNYNDEDVVGDESNYVASRILLEGDFSRTSLGTVTSGTNTINVTSSKPYDGMYSAGHTDQFDGQIQVYYSYRAQGDAADLYWDVAGVWTTNPDWQQTGPTGSDGSYDNSSAPGVGDIVVIGFGRYNGSATSGGHRVSIGNQTKTVAMIRFVEGDDASTFYTDERSNGLPEMKIRNGATLNVGVVENIGRFRIYGGTSTPDTKGVLNGEDMNDFLSEEKSELMIQNPSGAGTYGDFVIPTYSKYPTLRLYGADFNGGDYVFDEAITEPIQIKRMLIEGERFRATKDLNVEGTINIGGFTEGTFVFDSDEAVEITCHDIVIDNIYSQNNDAKNKLVTEGTDDVIHRLKVTGDISIPTINNGSTDYESIEFDLYNGSTGNKVILELNGEDNASFTNDYTTDVVPDLYKIVMNKGTSITPTFTMNTNFTLPSSTTEELITLTNGTLVLDNSDINITPFAVSGDSDNGSNWVISSTSGLTLNQGILNIGGDYSHIKIDGKLTINGGTLNVANGGNENSIIYASGSEFSLTGGTVNIGTEFRRNLAADDAFITYDQTGGILNTGIYSDPSNLRGTFEVLGSSSIFNFTGGEINVYRGSVEIDPATSNIDNNGTLKLGNATTGENINIDIACEVGNVELVGTSGTTVTVNVNGLDLAGNLTVGTDNTLDMNSQSLSIEGDFVNNGTFTATNSAIIFDGVEEQTTSSTISANSVTIDKGTSTLKLGGNLISTGDLSITSGTLSDEDYQIEVRGNLTVVGNYTTGGSNGRIKLNGTVDQTLDIDGNVGRLEIANQKADNPKVSLVDNINLVADEIIFTSGVLDIKGFGLNLGSNVILTAANPFGKNNMIQISGGVNAKGITYTFPADAISATTIPIGYEGVYAPLTFEGDYDGISVTFKPIEGKHALANYVDSPLDINDLAIDLFWNIIFNGTPANNPGRSVTLQYDQTVVNANDGVADEEESDYIGIIIDYSDDTIQKLAPGLIDDVNNTLEIDLGSDLFSGDYFIGLENSTPDDIVQYTLLEGKTSYLDDVQDGEWQRDGSDLSGGSSIITGTILEIENNATLETSDDGSLGFKSFYKAVINGTLKVHVGDNQIIFNSVEGSGTIHFFYNEGENGNMPFADWSTFYAQGGKIIIEGTALNPNLSLNAPEDDGKLEIGGLELRGDSGTPNQTWSLPDSKGLKITSGDLVVKDLELDLTADSELLNVDIQSGGTLSSTSTSQVSGTVNVTSGGTFKSSGIGKTLTVLGATTINGDLSVEESSTLDITSLSLGNGSSFTMTTGTELNISGNITVDDNSTVSLTSSTLQFDGSGTQTFTGNLTGSEAIPTLNINKVSGQFVNSGNKEFNNLILNSAVSNDGNADGSFKLLEDGVMSGASYVSGPLSAELNYTTTDEVQFLVGRNGYQIPLGVEYTAKNDALDPSDVRTWTVEYQENSQDVDSKEDADVTVSQIFQWRVNDTADNASALSDANITMYFGAAASAINGNINDLGLGVWDGSKWVKSSETPTTGSDYIKVNNVSFSEKFLSIVTTDEFTDDADDIVTELPVELVSFYPTYLDGEVILNWATAQEINNDYFEIQRSFDGRSWTSLGIEGGAGNSNVQIDYTFVDEDPGTGLVNYRLVQYDYDGQSEIHGPVQVNILGEGEEADVHVYPNPLEGEKVYFLLSGFTNDVDISVYNLVGNIITTQTWELSDNQRVETYLGQLPEGMYIVRFKSGKTTITKRLIVK